LRNIFHDFPWDIYSSWTVCGTPARAELELELELELEEDGHSDGCSSPKEDG
jgi:hypothetical protein